MKNKLAILLLILSCFSFGLNITNAEFWNNWSIHCSWYNFDNKNANVWDALDKCLGDVKLIKWNDVKIDWWFSNQIKRWTENISVYLWVFAVASIIIWALMLTFSAGEEEKIKKAKDVIKWWIIWFLWIIVAATIVRFIIKVMYSI
jgi:hypothetical protein